MTFSLRTNSLTLLTSSVFAISAAAQTPGTGAISGVVSDPGRRVVAHAEIAAISEATGLSRTVVSNEDGVFRVPLLPPGPYRIEVHASGFGDVHARAVVAVSETTSLQLTLSVMSVAETVDVDAIVLVNALESSTLGGLVDGAAVRSLPLSNRNYTQILALSPGVIVDVPFAAALGNGSQNIASNGAMPTANNIQFNGIDANNLVENSAAHAQSYEVGTAIPAPDAIQEFKVQTGNYDAAYGRGSGANVDLITRSGSNVFHGSLWEFIRNDIFNANPFFNKLSGQPRPTLKQNEFGGSIGGPIRRDKTFFFASYQGITEVNGLGALKTTSLPLLTQDRSASSLGRQFCPANHLNSAGTPSTGYLTQAGGTQVACDGSNINAVALAVLNAKLPNGHFAIPSPQIASPASGSDPSNQFPLGQSTFAIPAVYREDQFTTDIDHALSVSNTLSGRFFYSRAPTSTPFSPNAANVPGWGSSELDRNTMFVLADTHLLRPSLINIARFGFMRFDGNSAVINPLRAQAVGQSTPTGPGSATDNLPGLTVGSFTIGDAGTPAEWQVTNTFVWQDTVSLSRGRNNARFGVEFKRHEVDENQPQLTDGLLQIATFEDFLVGQSAAQNGSPTGTSNVTNSAAGGGDFRRDERYTNLAAFAQDDIKLLPRFTLNAGLRYEIFGAPTETNGRLTNFVPALATAPVTDTGTFTGFVVPANLKGAIPAGVTRTSYRGFYITPRGDISPRAGFAWQLTEAPTLVVRGGFGIYYDQHSGNLAEQTLSQLPFASSQFSSGSQNAGATLQNPFVPLVLPNTSYPIFQPRTTSSFPFIEGTNPNLRDGKTYEYNLNVQYALGHSYMLELGYVGTNSVHRPGQVEFNQALLASHANPVNGETTNSISNASTRMPIQGISQGSLFTDSVFVANFNALELQLRRTLRRGFQVQGSYTWSKNLDEVAGEGGIDVFELQLPSNNQLDLRRSSYGLAGDDRSQRAVVNFVWTVPKLANAPGVVRNVLGHWEFSGIGVIQTGNPLSIIDGNAGSVYALLGGQVRAQLAPGHLNPSTKGSLFDRVVGSGRYLNAAAFTAAPEAPNGTSIADQDFGNSGVGLVRGPGQHSVDAAIERIFPVFREANFRFRAEVFNLTNTPQFGNPSTSLGYGNPLLPVTASATFGQISGEQGGPHPRIIQFAGKFNF